MRSRVYETDERPSVCLSVPSFARRTPLGGFAAKRRTGRRYRSTAAAAGRSSTAHSSKLLSVANANNFTLTADLYRKPNTDLLELELKVRVRGRDKS